MKLLLLFGSIFGPLAMFFLQKKWLSLQLIFNILVILSALTFGNIAAFAIYEILQDQTVFMTNIHGIFLNPFFLITGAYLGVYILYSLFYWTLKSYKMSKN